MVRPVDENDFGRRFAKGFGRSQTTETAANDHYPRCLRRPLVRAIARIQIGLVHPSFLKLPRPEISENLGFSRGPRWSGRRYVFSAEGAASMPAWGSAPGSLMDCERTLKARLIDLAFGMNRAFSAYGFVIITGPAAAVPA